MGGILAFGSIRSRPGQDIEQATIGREVVRTPFGVEFARYSCSRGGAPTVVPFQAGCRVEAEVFVLERTIDLADAQSLLWQRETGRPGSYSEPVHPGPNNVLARELPGWGRFGFVIYTDFPDAGKISDPDSDELAKQAIQSVAQADEGKDGISYLLQVKQSGLTTRLSQAYEEAILRHTEADTLESALESVRLRNDA